MAPAPPAPAAGATGAAAGGTTGATGAGAGALAGATGAATGALTGALTGATGAAAGALSGATTGATCRRSSCLRKGVGSGADACRRSRCLRKGVGVDEGEGIVDVWRDGAGSIMRMASRSRGMPFGTGKRGLWARTCMLASKGRRVAMSIRRIVEAGFVDRRRCGMARPDILLPQAFGR